MCPAAVRAWEELSHAVYRASTLLRSPPTRPCNVCPSGVAQQPLAAAVVVIPLQIGPSACSRNEMRLAFSARFTGTVPFPQSSERSNVRESHSRWQVQPRSAPVHTQRSRAPSPSPFQLLTSCRQTRVRECPHMLQMNCAQATHEERRTGASLL